jgi:hypothetical protein
LRHFLVSHRLRWSYLRRLLRGVGASSVGLDPYRRAPGDPDATGLSGSWVAEARELFASLWQERERLREIRREPHEGFGDVLELEADLGRFLELLRRCGRYDRSFAAVAAAPWRA